MVAHKVCRDARFLLSMKMQGATLKAKVVKGAVWTLWEKLSSQVVGFVVGMILARLLTPDDYGTVALTTIFFAVAGALVDGGLGNALIQKKESDELDFNSVFYVNVVLSIIAYIVLFFGATGIARFYNTPELILIVRLAAISLIINAVNAIQNAELTKKMLFHLSFRVSILTSIASAICGVLLAYFGYGVWAIVWSTLTAGCVGMVARWFIIAWRPRLMFSFARLKPLFSYGWKMAVSSLVDQIFVQINGLLIGKFYSKADVAYVNKGNSLPQLAMNEVDATLGRVSFPALVLMQGDTKRLREAMRKMIQCSTFMVFPLMVGVALCSNSLLRILFGPQWLPAAPYMMLACFSFALWPFHTINLKGIMVLGRSDIFLRLEIVKKMLRLTVILLSFKYGVFVFMAVSAFALGPLSVIINAWPNRKLLGYTIGMQLRDVVPVALICIAQALVICIAGMVVDYCYVLINVPRHGVWFSLLLCGKVLLQLSSSGIVFLYFAYMFRLTAVKEVLKILYGIICLHAPSFAHLIGGEHWWQDTNSERKP